MAKKGVRSGRPSRQVTRVGALAATGLFVATGMPDTPALALAVGPATTGKIYACYSDSTHTLFHLNYPKVKNCPAGETKLSWNARAPGAPSGRRDPKARPAPGGAAGPQGPAWTPGSSSGPPSQASTYVFSKSYASTSRPAIHTSSTVLKSLSDPVVIDGSAVSTLFTVNATVTAQNGSTGSALIACRLAQTGTVSGGTGRPVGKTPWDYVTAVKGHPATVAMTGTLYAYAHAPSSSSVMDVQCRASTGTNVHAPNITFVATPVAGRGGFGPSNQFTPRRTAASR